MIAFRQLSRRRNTRLRLSYYRKGSMPARRYHFVLRAWQEAPAWQARKLRDGDGLGQSLGGWWRR